ncbi:hypothetical protein [Shewanella waksmanii]|uniref:hypothetical protein n=1 Tax=Shewanella waksmanii TaxID=213783 RepID=UPI0037351CC6
MINRTTLPAFRWLIVILMSMVISWPIATHIVFDIASLIAVVSGIWLGLIALLFVMSRHSQ